MPNTSPNPPAYESANPDGLHPLHPKAAHAPSVGSSRIDSSNSCSRSSSLHQQQPQIARCNRSQTRHGSRLFHYTRATNLVGILSSNIIKQATIGWQESEKPAVWFSFEPHWEPTASPGLLDQIGNVRTLSFEELTMRDTPARIEIDPAAAPYDWGAFVKLSGTRRKVAVGLARSSRLAGGDPARWKVSFEPVHSTHWWAVEMFEGGKWVPLSEDVSYKDAA